MGVRVTSYDGASLHLVAPLEPNINHKLTAFGGSLYSLAVLCSIRYLRPVKQDMKAECRVGEAEWGRFLRTLGRHDRARLALAVAIRRDGEPAVEFTGRYVVHG